LEFRAHFSFLLRQKKNPLEEDADDEVSVRRRAIRNQAEWGKGKDGFGI